MHTINSDHGVTISYDKHGSGPPLVLVHGAFSDHKTNWEFVLPFFSQRFTVYAIARRGRGETDATKERRLEDEALDAAALIRSIGEPVFLLGHSYGAHVALGAASLVPSPQGSPWIRPCRVTENPAMRRARRTDAHGPFPSSPERVVGRPGVVKGARCAA
jgi:pimeloyl-ACP methyl ester carboxylesterase